METLEEKVARVVKEEVAVTPYDQLFRATEGIVGARPHDGRGERRGEDGLQGLRGPAELQTEVLGASPE